MLHKQKHQRVKYRGIGLKKQNVCQAEQQQGKDRNSQKDLLMVWLEKYKLDRLEAMVSISQRANDSRRTQQLNGGIMIKIRKKAHIPFRIGVGIVKSGAENRIFQKMSPSNRPFFIAPVIGKAVFQKILYKCEQSVGKK